MKLYFVTINNFKIKEVEGYLTGTELELQPIAYQIQEILNLDLEIVVKDKALKAYAYLGHPCVVEHGGLLIEALGNFPGGLSKVVWDSVGDKICSFIGPTDSRNAIAQSVIGYCDGKRVFSMGSCIHPGRRDKDVRRIWLSGQSKILPSRKSMGTSCTCSHSGLRWACAVRGPR
jgi:XTP/dITP diphosphohydrolase